MWSIWTAFVFFGVLLVLLVTAADILLLGLEHNFILQPQRCSMYTYFMDGENSTFMYLPSGGLVVRLNSFADKDQDPLNQPKKNILFCHGNGGNIDGIASLADELNKRGFCVYVLEYRGYGICEQKRLERTALTEVNKNLESNTKMVSHETSSALNTAHLPIDVLEAWSLIPNKSESILLGFSIGGGAVFQALSSMTDCNDLPAQTVILNSFYSFPQLISELVPLPFLGSYMSTQWTVEKGIEKLTSCQNKKLLIVGTLDDELIPFHHSKLIEQTAKKYKLVDVKLISLVNGQHVQSVFFHSAVWMDELIR
jgi:hypothetical protein